jgi:beta-glucosidase
MSNEGLPKSASKEKGMPHLDNIEEALKAFAPRDGNESIQYLGTSTSSFQNEPIIVDDQCKSIAFSDWELEIQRKMDGKTTRIPKASLDGVPNFSQHAETYVQRSYELGDNMYRLSLEFPRLCPNPNEFNEPLMGKYVEALGLIKTRNMEPFVTLQHFTMPKYLLKTDGSGAIKDGAWESPDVAKHFRFYVEHVARFLGDDDKVRASLAKAGLSAESQDRILDEGLVRYFMSINEPTSTLVPGYLTGMFPPYKRGRLMAMKGVLDKMVAAHDIAYSELKEELHTKSETPQIGVGYNWQEYEGPGSSVARAFDHYYTDRFERDGAYSDFLGFQYYCRVAMPLLPGQHAKRDWSDQPYFGDIHPEGIKPVLAAMSERYPRKDILITEFGFSDKEDSRRPYWILETMRYLLEAKKSGVPIIGLLLWSLVNNFEWNLGMDQHFGLFNESELDTPLVPSSNGIRSWEAWGSAVQALHNSTPETLDKLETCYREAYAQYKNAAGKY